MGKEICRLTKTDKMCIRIHVHQIDGEESFWDYIQGYGKACYEEGKRTGIKVKPKLRGGK